MRPALLTSAFGYTLGGLSVLVDLGRFWNSYRIPTYFWAWNFNSILLEVALCIMLYTTVLWIEVSPAVLEGWQGSRISWLRKISMAVLPKAVLVVLGGALYRFSTFLIAYNPGPQWSYFPSIWEFAVTIGFISIEILGYVVMVKLFPILRGTPGESGHGDAHPSPAGRRTAGAHPAPQPA